MTAKIHQIKNDDAWITVYLNLATIGKNDDVKHNFSTLLARCYVVTSFCNIWWHHFATFDDIILNDLHILDFE